MKKINDYVLSQSDNIRHIVIDHSVLIEEVLSNTIADLLDIDINTSKALGHNSGSLSFSQKIQLMKDKIGLESEYSNKLEAFLQIRNKFAHVNKIDNWKAFSSLSKTYKKIINDLSKWYESENNEEINFEDSVRLLYYRLTMEIFNFLFQINLDLAYTKGKERGSNEVKIKLLELVKEKAKESTEMGKLWDEFCKEILSTKN